LPDLKVDLKGTPVGQSYGDGPVAMKYGCPLNLQWENSGVNTCAASNTASNGDWSGLLVKDMKLTLKSGVKKFGNIQNSGDYSLTCSRYLGSSLGTAEKKDTVNISASPKPTVVLQAKNSTSPGGYKDDIIEINKGNNVELKWSSSNASSCKFYKGGNSQLSTPGLTGAQNITNVSSSVVYVAECFNTYVQDSATLTCSGSKSQDTMIIKVSGEKPVTPTLTVVSSCTSGMEVSWTDTDDTAHDSNGYYKIFRDGVSVDSNYKSNSYTDSGVSNGSSYTYSVTACNANGCSAATSVSGAYYCTSATIEHNLMIDILDGEDFTGTTNDWKVDGTGNISVSSDEIGTDETGDSTISSGSNKSFTCDKSDTSTSISCSYKFPDGSAITLGQETTIGSFIEWGTGCDGAGANCSANQTTNSLTLTMNENKNITAKFNDKYNDPYYLGVNVMGVGSVSIASYNSSNSATSGIKLDENGEETVETANKFTCAVSADVTTDYPTSSCSYKYKYGDILYINPEAGADYFIPIGDYDANYWNYGDDSSGCVEESVSYSYGKGTCKLTMDSDLIDGSNTRTADIYFGKATSEIPDPTDPPSATNNNLIINILDAKENSSDNDRIIDGTGKIVITSNYSGNDTTGDSSISAGSGTSFICEKKEESLGSYCSYSFPEGSQITLKQQAYTGTFVTWATCDSGGNNCNTDTSTGSGDKTVILGTDKYINASFNDKTNDSYTLTVDILDATDFTGTANDKYVDGMGNISISSDKTGTDETGDSTISSGSNKSFTCKKMDTSTRVSCSYKFPDGSAITLGQETTSGSFIEWGTGCDGSGDNCTGKSSANSMDLTMNSAKNITAKFNDKTNDSYTLTVDILDATDFTGTANDKYVDGTGNISVVSNKNGTDETGDSSISSGSDTSFTCKKSDIYTNVVCYYKFPYNSSLTIGQSVSLGTFKEWGVNCDSSGENCAVTASSGNRSATMDSDKYITAKFNDTSNDEEILEEVTSQPVELSASETMRANIIENLPANSNKIIITVSSQSYDGELALSANIAQTGLKGAVAEFISGETITVSSGSWTDVEFRIKSIPASKLAGIYPLEITATDQNGNKYTLTVNLNLGKTSVQWREI
jgi:hypothetical protein